MSSTLESVQIRTDKPQVNEAELTYEQQHKPRSEFESREQYLEHELQIMAPRRWRPNLPFKDYRFEVEDAIPAMAATIGEDARTLEDLVEPFLLQEGMVARTRSGRRLTDAGARHIGWTPPDAQSLFGEDD